MFRWCSYCQHLIGESEPLSSYELTHGCCEPCQASFPSFKITPRVLEAKRLFNLLLKAGRSGDEGGLDLFIAEAARAGLRGSDILVGLMQPALYEIGTLWERGEVTVALEHRFSVFCRKVLDRDQGPREGGGAGVASILLALSPDNSHDLGVRILERLALEKGVRCRVLPTGATAPEIVSAAIREKPSLLGLSVAMSSSLTAILELRDLLRKAVPGLRVAIGGRAIRHLAPNYFPDTVEARRVDDFMAELAALSSPV
jgi:methanogenic corrinoid protein MtbC1